MPKPTPKPPKPAPAAPPEDAADERSPRAGEAWERYDDGLGAGGPEGLAGMMPDDGATEVLIATIEDVAKGQVRLTHPRVPGDTAVAEGAAADRMLRWKAKASAPLTKDSLTVLEQQHLKVREDGFALGGEDGGRVVFSSDAWYYILLTDEVKYRAMQNGFRFFREDPVFRGMVMAIVNYIIGGGLKFDALDENPAVDAYLKLFWTANKMNGRDRTTVLWWLLTGEISLRFHEKGPVGAGMATAKVPGLRLVPFWRIAEVVKDPNDAETIKSFTVWKASGPYRPQLESETVSPDELMFWKNATDEEDRGEPPLLAAMRPCKWYQDWMSNRVMLNRWRSSVVLFKKIITGTPGKVSAVSSASPSASTSHRGLGGKFEKRLPKPGTVLTHNDKIEYDWKSPNLGAADAGEDGRRILLYIGAAAQVPEFVLGDASNANYASTFVAENPFIRQIETHQKFFEGVFTEVFRRVIEHGIKVGAIPKTSSETNVVEGTAAGRAVRRLLRGLGLREAADVDDEGRLRLKKDIPTRTDVAIEWPNLLHKNALDDARAAQLHQTMGLASKQTLRGKMGYDQDTEILRLAEEREEEDAYEAARQDALGVSPDGGDEEDSATPAAPKPGAAARGGK